MARHSYDRAVSHLAARQHGVFSYAQVRSIGMSDDMVLERVRSGRWHRVARSVFAMGGAPSSFHAEMMAATLLTDGSAVSDRPAAALHQLTGFGPCRAEVTTTERRSTRNPLAVVHRRSRYRSTKVKGIRVGTIDQVVADVAGTVSLRRLARALDDALLENRVGLGRVEDLAVRKTIERGRGAVDLRRLVEERSGGDPVPDSELEVPFRELLCSPGIPEAEFQMRVPWAGDRRRAVDAGIRAWMLIVEADGRRWHTRIEDFASDRRSDRLGLSVGWATVRFTYTDLTDDFDESLRQLRLIGAEREALLRRAASGARPYLP